MGTDLLILTVYFICISYVLFKALDSVEDKVSTQLDQETLQTTLNAQLDQQGLAHSIKVNVLPQGARPFGPLKDLTVVVTNEFADMQLYIDWDRSSLTRPMVGGGPPLVAAQRVIHLIPGMTLDLFQKQVLSVINPGQMVSASVTAEDTLKRNAETQVLEVGAPLIPSLERLTKLPPPMRGYSLTLALFLKHQMAHSQEGYRLLVPCNFKVSLRSGKEENPFLKGLDDLRSSTLALQPYFMLALMVAGVVALVMLYPQ